jgi:O-antigen/teichoic acid export membrane protein
MRFRSSASFPMRTPPRSFRSAVSESILLGWLIADQGIFALSNFITNVLFARWLLPVDYGMFTVSFSGYLLLTVFHFGTILEPLLVQSAQVGANRLRSYIVTLIGAHVILIGGVSFMAGTGFWLAHLLHVPEIGLAILGAGIGGSFMCTLLTARRLCLVFLSTRVSALIGILYMSGAVFTTYLIYQYSHVTWFDIWLIMGVWSFLCSGAIFVLLYASLSGGQTYSLGEFCKFQWQYARYGLVASVCSWIRSDAILLILAHAAGLEVIAQTRAVLILANPFSQVTLALHSSWLVAFSRDHSRAKLWQTAAIYAIGAALVVVIAKQSTTELVRLIYNGRYLGGAWLLPWYCLAMGCLGLEAVFTCFLKAGGMLRRGYAPQIVGSAVSVALGLVMIPRLLEAGFVFTTITTFGMGAAMAFALVIRPNH